MVNVKGLEDVIRRKEFLFNVKIDRSQYIEVEKELEVVDMDNKKEEKEENKNKNEDKNENKEENLKEENKDNNKEEKNENKDIDNNKTKEEDKIKEIS